MADDGKQPKEAPQQDEKQEGGNPAESSGSGVLHVPSTHSTHSTHSVQDRSACVANVRDSARLSVSSASSVRSRSRSLSLPEDGAIPTITRRPSSRSLSGREELGIPSPDYSKSPPPLPPGEEHSSIPVKKAQAVLDLVTTLTGAEVTVTVSQSKGFVSDESTAAATRIKEKLVQPKEGLESRKATETKEKSLESGSKPLVSNKKPSQPSIKPGGSKRTSSSREKLAVPEENVQEPSNPGRASSESKIGLTEFERQSSKSKCASGSTRDCGKKSVSPSSVSLPGNDERFVEDGECSIFGNNVPCEQPLDDAFFKVPRSVSANCVGGHSRKTASHEKPRPRSVKACSKPSWFLSLQNNSNKKESHAQNSQEFEGYDAETLKGRKNRRRSCVGRMNVDRSLGPTLVKELPNSANHGRRAPMSTQISGRTDPVGAEARLSKRIFGNALDLKGERANIRTCPRKSVEANVIDDVGGKISLEDSWCSLRAFEKSHMGRLGNDVPPADGAVPRKKLYVASWGTKSIEEDGTCIFNLDVDFTIPELPKGEQLVLNILSTWGDRHYVGLNGIEIFRDDGQPVEVEKIWADPADINVLPEYSHDPRVVTNLLDGVYVTCDDMHLWLAPFTPNKSHYVYLKFAKSVKVAMIRIWNYNKSRIHSFRGVRYVEMTLDGHDVFKGDIAKACGEMKGSIQSFGDTILFTTDEEILEAVSRHDTSFREFADQPVSITERTDVRPPTADGTGTAIGRPFTTPGRGRHGRSRADPDALCGKVVELQILENWGDPSFVGLTGIEVLGANALPVEVKPDMLMVTPASHRTAEVASLVDGTNVTTDSGHMWRVPLAERITLRICLGDTVPLTVLKIWNYNANPEDSYQGLKLLSVVVDGRTVSPAAGSLVRKASGHCHFDFVQEIKLNQETPLTSSALPRTVFPHGFIFEIQILSTWGDVYYTGLNGLELRDADGKKIRLTEHNIAAFPESVNVLKNVENDVRTPDKLIDGSNTSEDACHSWLAPVLPHEINRVYIIFDAHVVVSSVRLWNYRKTPSRGVKDFRICVDELLVYTGELPKFERSSVPYHTVRFASADAASDDSTTCL